MQGEPIEVADGVYVIPDRRVPLVPNIGIVVGERAALVVDTGLGPRNGARVLAQARRLAGDRPLYLTTTHFHPEHGFGAQAFAGAATIVANRAQLDELRAKGAGYLAMFSGFGPTSRPSSPTSSSPNRTCAYDERLDIDLGGHTATLRAHGPAHTSGDQTVLVDGRVLFTGDLVETRMFPITPYFPPHDTEVDPGWWIGVLDDLIALAPDVVVPGHGEITDLRAWSRGPRLPPAHRRGSRPAARDRRAPGRGHRDRRAGRPQPLAGLAEPGMDRVRRPRALPGAGQPSVNGSRVPPVNSTQIAFSSRYSSIACTPFSRPSPELSNPPNGTDGATTR